MLKMIRIYFFTICFIFSINVSSVFALSISVEKENVIPYPAGYDITSEGASAANNTGDYNNSPYFSQLDFYNMKNGGSLVLLEKFKTYQQTTEWSCGNASAIMVLNYFGDKRYDELSIVEEMGTTPLPADGLTKENVLYGTTTAGMVNFFKKIGYKVESSLDSIKEDGTTFEDYDSWETWVIENLKEGKPILVDWIDWSGHWQVIIGYDTMGTETPNDDVLILADPYDVGDHKQDGYYIFPAARFFYMWNDFKYQPEGHQSQQWVVVTP